jgi:hypothetical protein
VAAETAVDFVDQRFRVVIPFFNDCIGALDGTILLFAYIMEVIFLMCASGLVNVGFWG